MSQPIIIHPKSLQHMDPMGARLALPLVFQPKLRRAVEKHFQTAGRLYLPLGKAKRLGINHRILFLNLPDGQKHPFIFGSNILKSRKSKIYHAFNLYTGEHIIIKMIPDFDKSTLLKQAEKKREVKLLTSLGRFKGSQEAYHTFFIGQQFLPGLPLTKYVRQCKKLVKNQENQGLWLKLCHDIVNVSILFVQAIYDLHQQGYIHRDIKCSNCILAHDSKTQRARCTMIDFGGMNKKQQPYSRALSTTSYRAPELTGKKMLYTQASDVYSMGKALDKLFSPCQMEGLAQYLQAQASAFYSGIDLLIKEIMNEAPNARPSAGEVKHRLETLRGCLPSLNPAASAL